MPDAGDVSGAVVPEGAFDGGMDSSAESLEAGLEGTKTVDSELSVNESKQELYDPGYNSSEYETELLDFSYELKEDPSSFIPDSGVHYNIDGDPVSDTPIVADENFLIPDENYNENGLKVLDWDSFAVNADSEGKGFDMDYPVTNETLLPDTIIARYGSERGRFATDKGTDYSKISKPHIEKSEEYHEYRVIAPVLCEAGIAAKNFGQEGGGKQYFFTDTFSEMANPDNPNRTMERIK